VDVSSEFHILGSSSEILTGTEAGKVAFIPRITLESNKGELEFLLNHQQFLVRLTFAMMINKSQGQSLGTVGICLTMPVFLMDNSMLEYPEELIGRR